MKPLLILLFLFLPLLSESKPKPRWKRIFKREHKPRYYKYDKDGLLKSSTPLFLDKSKGRKTKLRAK